MSEPREYDTADDIAALREHQFRGQRAMMAVNAAFATLVFVPFARYLWRHGWIAVAVVMLLLFVAAITALSIRLYRDRPGPSRWRR
ncbi:MAG: hypothetical protein JWN36_3229 [Microbacteriaceae bacterium]|nr:hypothetical protein [Microbacteriaceae bacterium]